MIELKNKEQMNTAIETAKANARYLLVSVTKVARQYEVYNQKSHNCYLVSFFLSDRKRFGKCTCKTGENKMLCKHIAAAAALNISMAERGAFNRLS